MTADTLHGHSRTPCPPLFHADDHFCALCHSWFYPASWVPHGSPMSATERGLLAELKRVKLRKWPRTAHQKALGLPTEADFLGSLNEHSHLANWQRVRLAKLAHRYRRKMPDNPEQLAWVAEWREGKNEQDETREQIADRVAKVSTRG